jgi:lipase chaperone LimK
MFGWSKRRKAKQEEAGRMDAARDTISAEERERQHRMRVEQLTIQQELGFNAEDDTQSWLRLHQLLKSHEERITALEKKNDRKRKVPAQSRPDQGNAG